MNEFHVTGRPRLDYGPRKLVQPGSNRLLVVEDDLDLCVLFERIASQLRPAPKLDWATSVDEAIGLLESSNYEAVLLDYWLAGPASGYALGSWITRNRPGLSVGMMSSLATERYLEWSEAAIPRFLAKPFSVTECREFVRSLLAPGNNVPFGMTPPAAA